MADTTANLGLHYPLQSPFNALEARRYLDEIDAAETAERLRSRKFWIDIRDFGAVCDDSTDDSAAVQAAIDSLGTTAATRGGPIILIPDHTAIGNTVTIDRKTCMLRGLGWGRVGASGAQSYLRWIGSAGSPMLKITNVSGFILCDLHLIGNATNKPSSAISFYQGSAVATTANLLENILIGDATDGTAIGAQFIDGIRFEGLAQNNAEWQILNLRIGGCSGSGIYQESIQYANTAISGLAVSDCAVGVNPAAQITGVNWNFSGNGTDIYYRALDDHSQNIFPEVQVLHFASEGSQRLWEVEEGGVLSLTGGVWAADGLHADGRIVKNASEGSRTLRLVDFMLGGGGAGYVEFKSTATGHGQRNLIFDGMRGFPSGGPSGTGLDVATLNRQDHAYIYYRASVDNTTPEYIPPHETKTFLYGVAGEDFRFDSLDVPARLRLIPDQFGQDIDAASDAITPDAALKLLKNATGSNITLTSTPTIAAGFNGDVMIVLNGGPDPITLQDAGTLSGSLLRLGNYAPSLRLNQYDSAKFIYVKNAGRWVLQATTVTVRTIDDAYDATTWNGNTEVPTKNAIRDKIEAVVSGISSAGTTYTCTATATGFTFGTITAKYWQIGANHVFVDIQIHITTAGAGGFMVVDLPFTPLRNTPMSGIHGTTADYGLMALALAGSPVCHVRKFDGSSPMTSNGSDLYVAGMFEF